MTAAATSPAIFRSISANTLSTACAMPALNVTLELIDLGLEMVDVAHGTLGA